MFVAVVGVILTVTVCSLAGYAFAKMDFKGNDKLFIFFNHDNGRSVRGYYYSVIFDY